jgi:hypothetical protein
MKQLLAGDTQSLCNHISKHIFDQGGPLACRANNSFPLCRQGYVPAGRSCRCCRLGHVLQRPPCMTPHWTVCKVILIARLPQTPALISPAPGTTHALHFAGGALFCRRSSLAAHPPLSAPLPSLRPRAPSSFSSSSQVLLLTSDWPRYHHRLYALFTDVRIHLSGPAHCCTPFSQLYADFLCLLANSLGLMTCLQASQPTRGIAVGCIVLQPRPVPYTVCTILLPTWHLHGPLLMFDIWTEREERVTLCLWRAYVLVLIKTKLCYTD